MSAGPPRVDELLDQSDEAVRRCLAALLSAADDELRLRVRGSSRRVRREVARYASSLLPYILNGNLDLARAVVQVRGRAAHEGGDLLRVRVGR